LSLIEELEELQTRIVAAGGYEWQIQPITSADLAVAGRAEFLTLPLKALRAEGSDRIGSLSDGLRAAQAEIAAAGNDANAIEAATARYFDVAEDLQRLLQETDPGALRMAKEQQAAVVMAGVIAARKPGGAWEPIHLVSGNRPSDPARGIMNLRLLPPGAEEIIATAVMALADEGGWAAAVAKFRGGSGAVGPAGQAGEPQGVHNP